MKKAILIIATSMLFVIVAWVTAFLIYLTLAGQEADRGPMAVILMMASVFFGFAVFEYLKRVSEQ